MKIKPAYYIILFFSLLGTVVSAQYIQVNDNYTAQQMVDALVGNSCAQVSNITVKGWDGSAGGNSYGYFTSGASSFPFSNGIVLSTGFAASAPGPNNSLLSEGSTGWIGDPDLEAALAVNNTINATILEFDFIPYTSKISFDYIFSSEQYLTSITSQAQCNYTDGFAFLLKEAGSASPYRNLAVVPGTNTPVKVNTVRGTGVCPAANEAYFGGFNGSNHPTNFNGQTVILKAQADVVAGTLYHIKLVVADQGNNLYDSAIFFGGGSFNATTDIGPDRLISTGNPLCAGETLPLNATTPNATGYQWYRNGAPIPMATGAIYNVLSAGEYKVDVELGGSCTSVGKATIEYAAPIVLAPYTFYQCDDDNDGLTAFYLARMGEELANTQPGLSSQYYYKTMNDAVNDTNRIINPNGTDPYFPYYNTIPDELVYVRVYNQFSCYSIVEVTLDTPSPTGLDNPAPLEKCDTDGTDDGITGFDLTQLTAPIMPGLPAGTSTDYYTTREDALAMRNAIAAPLDFRNTILGGQTIYIGFSNQSGCYDILEAELIVNSFGGSLDDEEVILCKGTTQTLNAGSGYTSYTWNTMPVQSTQSIIVSTPGIYSVTVTNTNNCSGTKTFTVVPSGAATNAAIEVDDFTGNQNSITITPQGAGSYEYSLDGITYQDSPVFNNLPTGEYTVYINDINGCSPVYTDKVYILDYPVFFTPNGDGVNETWRIPFLNFYPDAVITIFDRYGKAVGAFKGDGAGWDGTFKNKRLPSTDYWFEIRLLNNRIIRGHFALIR